LRNPYAIYARHVLRLQKLEPLENPPDAAARGTLLHDALSDFVENNPDILPPDAARQLYDRGVRAVAARADDPGFWEFWLPRYAALCDWFAAQEGAWRAAGVRLLKTECRGRMELAGPAGPFRLRVRADRVDRLPDGRVAAIDYKSGNSAAYSTARIAAGELPQLPLTALIIAQGGMDGVPAADCGYLGYWILTGATPPGEIKSLSDDISAVTAQAHTGLAALIAAFDDPATPYIAAPRAAHAPAYDDYDHLARTAEWGAAEEAA
jgi:ATP-dependent helicase/nuclease subunit B